MESPIVMSSFRENEGLLLYSFALMIPSAYEPRSKVTSVSDTPTIVALIISQY